jgi:glycosyltransferase involved in cell wall biosynthesis
MNTQNPLVSVIVPTRNSATTLEACLSSIRNQEYPRIELVVIDRDSTDTTKEIAAKYADLVLNHGPERSAQRNHGVEKASGEFVVIIDSDMVLSKKVIGACIEKMADEKVGGIIIPEESFGKGFWAQCKRLERSYYVGIDWIEAARFFRRDLYLHVGGYDTDMVSGEDWDLSRRIGKVSDIARVDTFIYHNEGRLNLRKTLQKKYYYAGLAKGFLQKNNVGSNFTAKEGPLYRYKLFFSKPGKLLKNPVLGVGMLFMKTSEYAAGAAGYYLPKKQKGNA